jgi:hypothetical protein
MSRALSRFSRSAFLRPAFVEATVEVEVEVEVFKVKVFKVKVKVKENKFCSFLESVRDSRADFLS